MNQDQLFRVFRGDAAGGFFIRQVGDNAAGETQHVSLQVGDNLRGAALDDGVCVNLLEDVIRIPEGIIQRTPGFKGGTAVAAHEGDHVLHYFGGGVGVLHFFGGAGPAYEGHASFTGIDDGAAAVHGLNLVDGQSYFGGGLREGGRAEAAGHQHDQNGQDS